ncbi:MAG: glycoside hydrolase family 16 protein [Bacteroidales bacterium]|nr:glycoside hydrolase family 16 protein [Bacteroidales bacterium]
MKKIALSIYLVALSLFVTHAQEYKLVWEDNFDKSRLDKSMWTIANDGEGGGNSELQYYHPKNVTLGKEPLTGAKCLILTAKRKNYNGKKATSGKVITQNKVTFKYGKIEARIKMPYTKDGLWPAFWLLGNDSKENAWPKCGEIDILEMGNDKGIAQGVQDRYLNGACHWGEKFNNGSYPNYAKFTIYPYSLQGDFHLFTLIWDSKSIKMYVDLDVNSAVEPYYELAIDGANEVDKPARYFNKPYFILFNLAVGGNFTKIWDMDKITALKDGEAKMYVDYVRVYQKSNGQEEISFSKK